MATSERPRILLLIPHLGGGGAEQVTALLARGLSREKYEVHLGLVLPASIPEDGLPPWVTMHTLGASRVRKAGPGLLRLIRRLRPRLILSGMFHMNFLVLLLRPLFPRNTRVLIRQNGHLTLSLATAGVPGFTRFLYRRLYPCADCTICQSVAMAQDLASLVPIPANRITVLPNPLDIDRNRAVADGSAERWSGPGPHLLSVGRLSNEKGFDLLLRALVSVRERYPRAELLIAGAGSEEELLRALCRDLGLANAVRFSGYVDHPAALFPGATLFVLPSRQDGMPNALLEAAAGGLPLLATPASGGIVHLLDGQPGAWLTPDISVEALGSTIRAALAAIRPGQRFAHEFVEPFGMKNAIRAYEELIDRTLVSPAPESRP